MGAIKWDQLFQCMNGQIRPAGEILVEIGFELILKHRALLAWEHLKIREVGWIDKHRTPFSHGVHEGLHDAISVLVNTKILPDDADPCPLQTNGIQKLGVVLQEMAITLAGAGISWVHTGQG